MSNDLIRRSDAIKLLNDYLDDCYRVSRRKYEKTMLDAISMDFEAVITDIPAVEPKQGTDLVKVTRCKDCFHFAPGTEKFDAFCVHNSVPVDEDGMGFCSEGVKKTEILDDPREGEENE